jgi:hypothetical protein
MGAEAVGREVVLERGAGAGSVTREWTSGGSAVLFGASLVGGAAEREKGEERGGPAMGVPCGVGWSWGLAPTGGRRIAVRTAARWR